MRYLEDCLKKRVIFFTGKGGVGKGTVAWATAVACSKKGAKVRVVTWNPLESISTIALSKHPEIQSEALETVSAFKEYVLHLLKFETLYNTVFDNHVLRTFIRAAPGLSETVIAGKVWDLYDHKKQDLLLVDLPASGHAVSFFQSPLGVSKLFRVGWVHREAEKICSMFSNSDVRIDLVALPEELPITECKELRTRLCALHSFRFGFLHLNQCTPDLPVPPTDVIHRLPSEVRQCYFRHGQRMKQETAAKGSAAEIQLPTLEIPRLPEPKNAWEMIDAVATHLEAAS